MYKLQNYKFYLSPGTIVNFYFLKKKINNLFRGLVGYSTRADREEQVIVIALIKAIIKTIKLYNLI